MTELTPPTAQSGSEVVDAWLESWSGIWSESLSQVFGQIAGSPVPCAVKTEPPADVAPAGESDFFVMITSSSSLCGEMSVRLAPAALLQLAQTFMSEPLTAEAPVTADHRDAVVELLRQVGGLVSTSAKPRWGEIQISVELSTREPSWPSAATFWLFAGEQTTSPAILQFGLSAALVAALKTEKAEDKLDTGIESKTDTPASSSSTASGDASATDSPQPAGALDLLMDVQLALTLRFGSKTLLLREVLDLSAGSVVELDRKIQEPVDLLLDGRLVARGEVVVIDGNYGLRVTDVSPLDEPKTA
jgi:flagellar motor switch protein FliN